MTDIEKELEIQGFKTINNLDFWEKAYWYLRILIDTNRYGALAKDSKRVELLYNNLLNTYKLVISKDDSVEEKLEVLKSVFEQTLFDKTNTSTNKYKSYLSLSEHLPAYLKAPKDYFILAITMKELLIPTNKAVENVPTTESTDFARKYGKAVLDIKKEQGLDSLIRDWDNFTEVLSLNKERDLIVGLVADVRNNLIRELTKFNISYSEKEFDIIITAVCQEYERRVGQKRKQRAGSDLESVTEFIFNYFKIKTYGGPEHFTTGMEVDNWIKDKRGWYIGISLKRTLRERWKQTYSSDINLYNQHQIKYVIHIINNDNDLSDATITELGAYRHLFFMADNSNLYKDLQNHVAMKKYVFPMSQLIVKIKEFIEN